MESSRNLLFIVLLFLSVLIYQAWQEDHKQIAEESQTQENSVEAYAIETPSNQNQTVVNVETKSDDEFIDDVSAEVAAPVDTSDNIINKNIKPIEIITDKLRVILTPVGGNVISVELLEYKETLEKNSSSINLLENRDGRMFMAISGLYGEGAPEYKNKETLYSSEQTQYQMSDEEKIEVNLRWTNNLGVEYIKQYVFYKGQYKIEVNYLINNTTGKKIANRMFASLRRDMLPERYKQESGVGMVSYLGPAYYTDEDRYKKYTFDELQEKNLKEQTENGWVAILQHYFVTAWVPQTKGINVIDSLSKVPGKSGVIQIRIIQDWKWIEPGETAKISSTLYAGPKIQDDLKALSNGLEKTVDYGFLWWIGEPIFALLLFLQGLVINWGVAIILVTVVIKMLLYPLARSQYRSFAKMRILQPKLQSMKERYGDDKQQMSIKMMELYRKEKVNPLGGCFPLLIQMPVFIALYWVLMESVELRHAPFILWIEDMSVKDPYLVLPLLMGASMYLMQKMQPTSPTMDPMQQKILQMMPVFMTVFFIFFPAGLVLYWLFNNLISIAQQIYITRQFDKEQEAGKKK
ncbi:MAG: membrane protein insertase YidC [Gammaproteobacteria bacterium]|nr:membrane protein insertase YidC [Gammaproteobacteria bacterium]MDH5629052.1 membrane protein insertase YidC [Gammaproteobacteria bacterium]